MPDSPAPTIRTSKCSPCFVVSMARPTLSPSWPRYSRPEDGVASARLCPAIHVFAFYIDCKDVDARHKAGHDEIVNRDAIPSIPVMIRLERAFRLDPDIFRLVWAQLGQIHADLGQMQPRHLL